MPKILIIEDQEILCQLYRSVLRQFGYEVQVATTGEAGLVRAISEPHDLIILDLVLPGIHGSEVARKLKEAGILPETPLIITTALGDLDAQTIAQAVNADGVLVKPFEINVMLESVRAAVAGSPYKKAPCV